MNKLIQSIKDKAAQEAGFDNWHHALYLGNENTYDTIINSSILKSIQMKKSNNKLLSWMKPLVLLMLFIIAMMARCSGNDTQAAMYVCTSMIIYFMPDTLGHTDNQ